MHKIRFPLGICPDPVGEAYSAPPDLLAVFKGPTSKGRAGEEGVGREGASEGRGSKKRERASPQIFLPRTAPDFSANLDRVVARFCNRSSPSTGAFVFTFSLLNQLTIGLDFHLSGD